VSEPFSLLTLLRRVAITFGPGLTVIETGWILGIAAVLAALTVIGSLAHVRRKWGADDAWSGIILSLLYCAMPVLAMYVLSRQRPMYNPKFLLLATPGYYLLAGHGLEHLLAQKSSRVDTERTGRDLHVLASSFRYMVFGIGVLLIVGGSLYSLRNLYFDPRYARDDYRGIAEYISSIGREGDAILINAPSQIETFVYYYHGDLPIYPLPRQRPIDEEKTRAELRSFLGKYQRIFAILWATDESDPNRFIEGWLDRHGHKALDAWYGNVRLVVYALTGRIRPHRANNSANQP